MSIYLWLPLAFLGWFLASTIISSALGLLLRKRSEEFHASEDWLTEEDDLFMWPRRGETR